MLRLHFFEKNDSFLFSLLSTGMSEARGQGAGQGAGGTHAPAQFLVDLLTLSQSMPTNYYTPSQIFRPSDSPEKLRNNPMYLVTEKIFQGIHLNVTRTNF